MSQVGSSKGMRFETCIMATITTRFVLFGRVSPASHPPVVSDHKDNDKHLWVHSDRDGEGRKGVCAVVEDAVVVVVVVVVVVAVGWGAVEEGKC